MKLSIENLNFSYGSKKVLENISFSLNSGEFIALLGANGEGKTTLFRSILGFLNPESGTIKLDDKEINTLSLKEKAKKIAYIPQESKQTFDYSVKNTVLMGITPHLSSMHMPKKEDEKRVNEVLSSLGILKLKDKSINQISGGERQLVFTARAIVQNASILIFDEPTSSLDCGNSIMILKKIKTLAEKGYGALVAIHNIEYALNYASRLILLKDKHIIFDGDALSLSKTNIFDTFYTIPFCIEKHNDRFIINEKTI